MSERTLLAAILVRAGQDFRERIETHERLRIKLWQDTAAQWIQSREWYPFSFEWVCANLELDSNYVRRKITSKRRKR